MLCLGAGNMVSAIVPSFKTIIPALSFTAFTPTKVRAEALMKKVGGNHLDKLSDLEDYDVILLGFKPQQFQETAREIKDQITPKHLIVSLLAGTRIDTIQSHLGTSQVIRLMPNTPAQVGAGASLMAFSTKIESEWKDLGLKLLDSLGVGIVVTEEQLNIATPYSGSGPAYFYLLTQLMIEDLKGRGFPEEYARTLCEQTFIGAAQLLKQSDDSVERLRLNVTSKGGVTHAAVESMLQSGLPDILNLAMEVALKRNSELAT